MRRRSLDADLLAFAVALGVLVLAAATLLAAGIGAGVLMAGLCLAGVVGARALGLTGPVTLVLALGLAAILWIVWIDPPASSRRVSVFAHFSGGALVGWALALTALRRRRPSSLGVILLAVLAVATVWEIGELVGDAILDTRLSPSVVDSAVDIIVGCAGAGLGFVVARVQARLGRKRDQSASRYG